MSIGLAIYLLVISPIIMFAAVAFVAGSSGGVWFTIGYYCLIVAVIWLKKKTDARFDAFVAADGPADYSHTRLTNGSSIAINRRARKIYFRIGQRMKSYSFDDVREFSIVSETAGRIVGYGLGAGLAAAGENMRAKSRAAAASGLFVTVKDIEHPEWQIHMPPPMQKRWMEILNQFVLEAA